MKFLATDLSKRSTGWAFWDSTQDRPVSGSWNLGSEFTPAGGVFLNLYQNLSELSKVCGEHEGRSAFDNILYEEPLNLGPHNGFTTKDTIFTLMGLAATLDLWAEAKRVPKLRSTNMSSWRRHFLGSIPRPRQKDSLGNKIKAPPINWKALAIERCQQLGFSPRTHDEAEALGILDYQVDLEGITPPWRVANPLLGELGRVRA